MTRTVGREGTSRSVAAPMLLTVLGGWCNGPSTGAFGAPGPGSSPGPPAFSVRSLCEHVFVRTWFAEEAIRRAIASASCWSDALRTLGLRAAGGNFRTIKKHAERLGISTEHFDPSIARARANARRGLPLETFLVEGSTYHRGHLKSRLYQEGLKVRACELCGQGEEWNGRTMALILDHINGVANDHRLNNLRIVCPNCAATLATHCGKNKARKPETRSCERCRDEYVTKRPEQRFCSLPCWYKSPRRVAPHLRKVDRPPYEQLLREIDETSWSAVGRKYGVSDNAVRKWVRSYERQVEREASTDSPRTRSPTLSRAA